MASDAARKDIVNFAQEQEEEILRERRESIDGQIFQFIVDNYSPEIKITLSMLFEHVTKTDKNKQLTERKLGNIVRKILGIDIERRGHENVNTLILEGKQEKLKELGKYYGNEVSANDVASVASVAKLSKTQSKYVKEADKDGLPF